VHKCPKMEMTVFIVNCEHILQSYSSTVVLILSVSVIKFGIKRLNFKENSLTENPACEKAEDTNKKNYRDRRV